MHLAEFEKKLTDYLFSRISASSLTAIFKSYDQTELAARLAIYRNNVFASLQSTLQDMYPSVVKTVGSTFFNASANIYIQQYPPENPVLIEYLVLSGTIDDDVLRSLMTKQKNITALMKG